MEIIQISYTNPLQRYYFQSFYDNVLIEDKNSATVPDFFEMFRQIANPERVKVWYCFVAVVQGKVVAGATAEYFERCRCSIVEYCVAIDGYEKVIPELFNRIVNLLNEKHPDMRYKFIELWDTSIFADRVQLVDSDYMTPPIQEGGEAVAHLKLYTIDAKDKVPFKLMMAFEREYFSNSFVEVDVDDYLTAEGWSESDNN